MLGRRIEKKDEERAADRGSDFTQIVNSLFCSVNLSKLLEA